MSKKTAETILKDCLKDIAINKPDFTFNMTIAAMQAYADQEKRSTAIAFVDWIIENKITRAGKKWRYPNLNWFSTLDLYDLYINSL